MFYKLNELSSNYSLPFCPLINHNLMDMLKDYQQGYDVDKDKLITALTLEFIDCIETLNSELSARNIDI